MLTLPERLCCTFVNATFNHVKTSSMNEYLSTFNVRERKDFGSSLLAFGLLLLIIAFIYRYRRPYRMAFVSCNSYTTGVTSYAGTP